MHLALFQLLFTLVWIMSLHIHFKLNYVVLCALKVTWPAILILFFFDTKNKPGFSGFDFDLQEAECTM